MPQISWHKNEHFIILMDSVSLNWLSIGNDYFYDVWSELIAGLQSWLVPSFLEVRLTALVKAPFEAAPSGSPGSLSSSSQLGTWLLGCKASPGCRLKPFMILPSQSSLMCAGCSVGSYSLKPCGLFLSMEFCRQNTEWVTISLFQGLFSTQWSNLSLLHFLIWQSVPLWPLRTGQIQRRKHEPHLE